MSGTLGWHGHGGISASGIASWFAARREHGIESVQDGAERSFLAPYPLNFLPSLEKGVLWMLNKLGQNEIRDLQPPSLFFHILHNTYRRPL
ncbi:MAG: hypothetical protein LBH03_06040 [Holophagales bacterium]|nr:hypothetical protein [Holophagales bacterium]